MPLSLSEIEARTIQDHLAVFGAFHPDAGDALLSDIGTVILVGPQEPGFWDYFQTTHEFNDGVSDPLDRWSKRVASQIAEDCGGKAAFPFGGPPYQPFIAWALKSGRAWQSPVGLLVHDDAGLMVSYRGAIAFKETLELPATPPCPCDTCDGKPCLTACPVDAFDSSVYDLVACHGYLETDPGRDCLQSGCAVRRACPVSQRYGRVPQQSAFHMKAFHP